jgi:hypothetical protein
VDNTEGEDNVNVACGVDCVFGICGELMLVRKSFHGVVMRNKVACTSV